MRSVLGVFSFISYAPNISFLLEALPSTGICGPQNGPCLLGAVSRFFHLFIEQAKP
jgi:hypothetical protein